MKTVAIYLGGTPTDGGTYQNALSLVASLGVLPRDEYRVIGYCRDDAWPEIVLAHGLEAARTEPLGLAARVMTKIARVVSLPVSWRRRIGSAVVPFGRQLKRDAVDLCIYPNFEHYAWELATPSLGAIHDLMHRYEPHFPEVAEGGIPKARDRMFGRMRRGATAVLVDSELGRAQVVESYGAYGADLHVLPYVAPGYVWDAADIGEAATAELGAWAASVGLPDRYLFYPAQFWQHKNHGRLLDAFVRLAAARDDARLVLVGSEKNGSETVGHAVERLGLAGRVLSLGYVTNGQMTHLYRHARALVMPTFFGPTNIPPLEAFALGCPVAVSGIYAMPELYGDAALYFDPRSEDEITDVIERLWKDDELCEQLRRRGYERAARWGPDHHAARLREIVDAVIVTDDATTGEAGTGDAAGAPASLPDVRTGTRSFALMQVLRLIVAFAVASLVSRQLGADGKGVLALVQQVPSIMALVFGFGFAGVNVYFVGSGKKTASEALTDSMFFALIATIAGVPLSYLAMRLLPTLSGFESGVLLLSSLVVPAGVLSAQVAGILVGQGRPEAQARAQSAGLVVNVAIVGALYLTVRLSVASAVLASISGSLLSIALMLAWLGQPLVGGSPLLRVRAAAGYARKRYLTDVAGMLEMRVDIVMLGALATAGVTGIYSVSVALVELLWFVPRAAETPLLARFMKEHAERGAALTAVAVRLTVLLEIVMLIGAALLLVPVVGFVFGPAFSGAPMLFWVLAPGVVANGLVGPVISYLTSRGHQFPGLSAATVLGNIALNAALIPMMGGAGAALASSVTYGIGSAWLFSRFMRETGVRPHELFVPRASDVQAFIGARSR
ncbi:MAG: glycosyltransferase [Coriobacteriia bacterium]|nr:glycosyltransferase [Coriobacteriia bacterium]